MIEINQFKKTISQLSCNGDEKILREILNQSCMINRNTPGFKEIAKAQGIINGTNPESYQLKPYLITTQNQRYLDMALPEDAKSACVILGSGDTVFELVSRDVSQIDAIDINDLQLMIYKLRRASLLTLSNKDYINFLINCYNHRFMNPDVFKNVKEGFDKDDLKTINFWEYLLSINPSQDLIQYFFKGVGGDSYKTTQSLSYLKSKYKYYELRDKLEKAHISVQTNNVIDYLKDTPEAKYDYIDITNILLFIFQLDCQKSPNNFSKIIEDLKLIYKNNLNDKGVFVLDYLFGISLEDLSNEQSKSMLNEYIKEIYQVIYQHLQQAFELESYTNEKLINCFGSNDDTLILTRKK